MDGTKRKLRCAVYTRKSTDDGLDQEFNSIDAQRDAGHALIASRRGEGWVAVNDDYDDPAFSGGNTERPALKRLLKDVEVGLVDVIVVYKVDRLTRSLSDFFKMIDILDKQQVSFVSVTESFDTSTSMGRLILNILLSFAQFQREDATDRIRHKIKLSKEKGYWVGGHPPLGYDIKDRILVINPEEAKTVNYIFSYYAEHQSVQRLLADIRKKGITTKTWTTKDGKVRVGKPMDKGNIYKILNYRVYIGEISHKDKWHKGQHKPIITTALWEMVQKSLAANCRSKGVSQRSAIPYLLKGMVFDPQGRALTTSTSRGRNNGRKYRYYQSIRNTKECVSSTDIPRIPADELENIVMNEVRGLLKTSPIIDKMVAISNEDGQPLDEAEATVSLSQIDKIWEQLFPNEQSRIISLLIERVTVSPHCIDMPLRKNGIEKLAIEMLNSQH